MRVSIKVFSRALHPLLGALFVLSTVSVRAAEVTAPANQIVGSLPYSNQWEYERPDSFVFVVYDPQSFVTSTYRKGDYTANFSSTSLTLYGINYLARMGNLLSSGKVTGDISLWLKSSLEFATPSSTIGSDTPLSSASSSGQLFLGRSGAGPMVRWNANPYFSPFIGVEVWGYIYRHSASVSTIDFSGQGLMLEPMVGIETRILEPVHAMAQLGFNQALTKGNSSLLANDASLSIGLGVMF